MIVAVCVTSALWLTAAVGLGARRPDGFGVYAAVAGMLAVAAVAAAVTALRRRVDPGSAAWSAVVVLGIVAVVTLLAIVVAGGT